MKNKYTDKCYKCSDIVRVGEGFTNRIELCNKKYLVGRLLPKGKEWLTECADIEACEVRAKYYE